MDSNGWTGAAHGRGRQHGRPAQVRGTGAGLLPPAHRTRPSVSHFTFPSSRTRKGHWTCRLVDRQKTRWVDFVVTITAGLLLWTGYCGSTGFAPSTCARSSSTRSGSATRRASWRATSWSAAKSTTAAALASSSSPSATRRSSTTSAVWVARTGPCGVLQRPLNRKSSFPMKNIYHSSENWRFVAR